MIFKKERVGSNSICKKRRLIHLLLLGVMISALSIMAYSVHAEDVYQIIEESIDVELDYENPNRAYITVPVDGKIEFTSDPSYALWNYDGISGLWVSECPEIIEAGTHFMELEDHARTDDNKATLSYVYYPECTVYYVDGEDTGTLVSYYLQKESEALTLPERTTTGYEFDSWCVDKELTEEITTIDKSVGKDWYLYPKKTPIAYNINYELDGGVNPEDTKTTYTIEDNSFTLPTPTKKGYDFMGWYATPLLETAITEIDTQQCKDVSVYAKWEKHTYAITYVDGYTHSNIENYTLDDEEIILKDATRAGYTFKGWYSDEDIQNR